MSVLFVFTYLEFGLAFQYMVNISRNIREITNMTKTNNMYNPFKYSVKKRDKKNRYYRIKIVVILLYTYFGYLCFFCNLY